MARRNMVALSDDEKALLVKTAEHLHGTQSVAWGAVVAELCENALDEHED